MTLHHIRVAITLLFVLTVANLAASFTALSATRELRDQMLLLERQGVVGGLAGSSCDSRGIDILSQRSRSFVSAAEQLGEQGETVVAGWRAAAGSGGIAGGSLRK